MPDISGPTLPTPFAFFDHGSSSWRTCEVTFPWDSTPFSPTLPPSGSMRSGLLCARPMLAPAIAVPDCSSLPTPKVSDADRGGDPERWKGSKSLRGRRSNLVDAATHFLPTPAVNDMGEGKTVEAWDAWTEKMRAAHGNGNGHGKSLAIEAQRLLPTQTSSDHKGATTPAAAQTWEHRGTNLPEAIQLLPTPTTQDAANNGGPSQWERNSDPLNVAVLRGALTPPPSPDTPPPSDGQHPDQLTIEDDSTPGLWSG